MFDIGYWIAWNWLESGREDVCVCVCVQFFTLFTAYSFFVSRDVPADAPGLLPFL